MKTTIIGSLMIIGAAANAAVSFLKTGSFDLTILITAITAGFGLIKAADAPKA